VLDTHLDVVNWSMASFNGKGIEQITFDTRRMHLYGHFLGNGYGWNPAYYQLVYLQPTEG